MNSILYLKSIRHLFGMPVLITEDEMNGIPILYFLMCQAKCGPLRIKSFSLSFAVGFDKERQTDIKYEKLSLKNIDRYAIY